MGLKNNKSGIFYTMDALLASMLLLGAIVLVYNAYSPEEIDVGQKTFMSQDILTVLGELKINELNNSFIATEIAAGNITDANRSVLDQVGQYWALGDVDKAQQLLDIVISDSLSEEYGIHASMGNDTLLLRNISTKTDAVSSNRMISGIEEGKPITGSSGTSYLKKIRNKKTASYAYFGGFIGQGNITVQLVLPSDYNDTRMVSTQMKLETLGTFEAHINNVKCGTNYTGNASVVKLWDIGGCNSSFHAGTNNISIRYLSTLNTSYISGGFIKATYTTDILIENTTAGYYRYYFPSIDGFINIYDSISVPGIVRNWTLNVSYDSVYSTFFNLANETIFIDPGQNTTRNILITYTNLSIPPSTIPIRMTHTNLTNITIVEQGLPSDSFLITDVSGSMNDCGTYTNQTRCGYEYKGQSWWWFWLDTDCAYNNVSCTGNACGISPIYSTRNHLVYNESVCSQTLLDIAKIADKYFVDVVLNYSTQHRIGLVDFSTDANPATNLTNVKAVLNSEIDTYTPAGGTCTCCGINRARNLLINSTNKKFMIVLSDGDPTHTCSNYYDYTGTSGSSNLSSGWAINASKVACNNNITVYSIGFGSSMSTAGHAVMRQIACNTTLYYNATNVTALASIYSQISNEILLAANFSSQTVNIQGSFNKTTLREGYLDIYYDDVNNIDTQNKISIAVESDQFNSCSNTVKIPAGITIRDAYVTSYSSNYWTIAAKINNNTVYNLSSYNKSFDLLGDPFIIQIPSMLLNTGQNNTIELIVGDSNNVSNCSRNNTLIYTALINVSTGRTDALQNTAGCKWYVESSSGSIFNITVPKEYSGNKTCYYNSTIISYDTEDVYDVSVHNMLDQLDYEQNGKIFFDLTQNDLEILLITTGQVAYMWGPSLINIEVWQ